jgi:dTDP-4-dehydrorhamnose reductase
MKTVLVTGSNGLLGQKITEQVLQDNQINLIASNRGNNRFPKKLGYTYVEMDICNAAQVEAVIAQYQPDVLIHTVAITNVDVCHQNPELCEQINVTATGTLVKLCERFGCQLIYISTDFVFDGLDGPYDENARCNPVSIYGHSKRKAEELVQKMQGKWAIVRTILVYGILKDMSRSNIVLWVKNALSQQQSIKVVNDQWRMPTLAEDLAWACLRIAELEAEGIFHISGKDMMSVSDIAYRVADFWSLDKSLLSEISSNSLAQAAKRPQKTGFVLDKAIQVLNYQAHSFEEGLARLDQQLYEYQKSL